MRARRVPVAVRREQILEAAFAVASRAGIGGLTVRSVAAEAQVSHGLVLFHFGRKEGLVHALLDWLLARTAVLEISEDVARFPRALDRLHALLQQEMVRLSHQPQHTRLFLEYWALGARHAEIRTRIGGELERYRGAFRALMAELIDAEPDTFGSVTAEGLAAVAVSWLHGGAVQAMVDPVTFDTEAYLAAVRGIVGRLSPGSAGGARGAADR